MFFNLVIYLLIAQNFSRYGKYSDLEKDKQRLLSEIPQLATYDKMLAIEKDILAKAPELKSAAEKSRDSQDKVINLLKKYKIVTRREIYNDLSMQFTLSASYESLINLLNSLYENDIFLENIDVKNDLYSQGIVVDLTISR